MTSLKTTSDPYPYPHKFFVTHTISEFIKEFGPQLTEKGQKLEKEVAVAARIFNLRTSGKALIFYDIRQEGQKLQVLANLKEHKGVKSFEDEHSIIRRGDIIGVKGYPSLSKTGELSICPGTVQLLSPCLHMLPSLHTGLKD